jgi:hypothetical protein
MSDKMRAMLDRAVEQANRRATAVQKGEFHPKIDVIRQGVSGNYASVSAKNDT